MKSCRHDRPGRGRRGVQDPARVSWSIAVATSSALVSTFAILNVALIGCATSAEPEEQGEAESVEQVSEGARRRPPPPPPTCSNGKPVGYSETTQIDSYCSETCTCSETAPWSCSTTCSACTWSDGTVYPIGAIVSYPSQYTTYYYYCTTTGWVWF